MSKRAFTPEERNDIQRVVAFWIWHLSHEHNSELADDLAIIARKSLSILASVRKMSAQTPDDLNIERLLAAEIQLFVTSVCDDFSRIISLRAAGGQSKH